MSEDTVTARRRGSCIIHRMPDTPSAAIPDYTDTSRRHPPLDNFYRWRISEWKEVR